MILKKNTHVITINENVGQIHRVTLVLGDYKEFLQQTPMISCSKKEKCRQRPSKFFIVNEESKTKIVFDSVDDKDYIFEISYFPQLKRI